MATKSISQLDTQATANETDLFEVAIVDANSASGYASKKESAAAIADAIVGEYQYPLRITGTTAKTIAGAINEIESSLAPVATSGAYSDLSGKPTIDTALDDTSTNAVENRAVASEINSIKSDITVEGSASGDIATFVDGSDNPLKELKISIEAVQSGSGDPSPSNVRPITGWTGCNANVSQGSVMLNKTVSLITISALGTQRYGISINTPGEYTFVSRDTSSSYIYAKKINTDQSYGDVKYIQADTTRYKVTFTIASGESIIIYNGISTGTATTTEERLNKVYNVKAEYPITWQNEAGTVYGGYLKPLTGELTVTYAKIKISDIIWTYNASYNEPAFYGAIDNRKYDSVITLISSIYKPVGYFANLQTFCNNASDLSIGYIRAAGLKQVYIKDLSITSKEAFVQARGDEYICYELKTPVTYQLTPTQVRSLLGLNNVWADCGAITELKYIRDLNLCINDIIARIEALEGGSNTRSLSVSPVLTKSLTSDSDKTEGILESKTEETEEETKEEAQNER